MRKVVITVLFALLILGCQQTGVEEERLYTPINQSLEQVPDDSERKVDSGVEGITRENVTLVEGQWAGVEVDGEEVVVRFEEESADRAVLTHQNSTYEIRVGGSVTLKGASFTLKGLDENAVTEEVGSEVWFWLGTEKGAFQDILEEGENKSYVLDNSTYEVSVEFIGEGSDGLGKVLMNVNGASLGSLNVKGTSVFNEDEFVFVKDIHYRDNPVQKRLDRAVFEVKA